ncbi:hypothetical protein J2046_003026 [Rhizobium petrolearium]|uniref:hypothetical protein n=1 Tax=Neorhizobium petrolearium TaxID=515361 RepID=UPI001AE510E7|nr:hypothetical protein [Neorhizobium petrolearium]MBP1844759.1 hypothetical protein [Neorhizobium petrolearium]
MKGQGGSYIRQADGSLKLVSRTEQAKPKIEAAASVEPAAEAKPAGKSKKESQGD